MAAMSPRFKGHMAYVQRNERVHNDAGSWVSNSDTGGHDRDVNRDARSQPRQKTDMVTWTCNVMQHDMQLHK